MQPQQPFPSLGQYMPLLEPIYPEPFFTNFKTLKSYVQAKKYDQESCTLAEDLLILEPGNYTAWFLKKMCLIQGIVTLEYEKAFVAHMLKIKVKSFQIWEHWRFVTERTKEYLDEYPLITSVLEKDYKNYHAWSYRIWVVNQAKNYQEELPFTAIMINNDSYNNSAWSYRFHLISSLLKKEEMIENIEEKRKILEEQINFSMKQIQHFPDNKASWNFLRGLFPSIKLKDLPCENLINKTLIGSYAEFSQVLEFCLQMFKKTLTIQTENKAVEKEKELTKREKEAEKQILNTLAHIYSENKQTFQLARNVCKLLALKDQQKKFYWKWVEKNLAN